MANAKKVKARVERVFIDRHTKKRYEIGDVISVTQRRYDEIVSKDTRLVSLVTE